MQNTKCIIQDSGLEMDVVCGAGNGMYALKEIKIVLNKTFLARPNNLTTS